MCKILPASQLATKYIYITIAPPCDLQFSGVQWLRLKDRGTYLPTLVFVYAGQCTFCLLLQDNTA